MIKETKELRSYKARRVGNTEEKKMISKSKAFTHCIYSGAAVSAEMLLWYLIECSNKRKQRSVFGKHTLTLKEN
jgi:hypothetical protein